MTDIRQLQRTWEHLAQEDPFWAICTDPAQKRGSWDRNKFFATGERKTETVLQHARSLGLKLHYRGPALDFGCGVGRLTQALCNHFDECRGVDISPTMIRLANELNRFPEKCRYVLNDSEALACFAPASFTLIYSSIVPQHMEPRSVLSCG